jgi:hypothetical protein
MTEGWNELPLEVNIHWVKLASSGEVKQAAEPELPSAAAGPIAV